MGNYKIIIDVKLVECNEAEQSAPAKAKNGSFEMRISEGDAISIDRCEKAVLWTGYESMREAISRHLTEASKKKSWSELKQAVKEK